MILLVLNKRRGLCLHPLRWIKKSLPRAPPCNRAPLLLLVIAISRGQFWVHVFWTELLVSIAAIATDPLALMATVAFVGVGVTIFLQGSSEHSILCSTMSWVPLQFLQVRSSRGMRSWLAPKSTPKAWVYSSMSTRLRQWPCFILGSCSLLQVIFFLTPFNYLESK